MEEVIKKRIVIHNSTPYTHTKKTYISPSTKLIAIVTSNTPLQAGACISYKSILEQITFNLLQFKDFITILPVDLQTSQMV